MKYLFIDTETGGVDGESLLTISMIVTDDKFACEDKLYLSVKPDDGKYIVSAGGLGVNKIDLVEHDKIAKSYKNAGPIIYAFIWRHFQNNQQEKLIPAGHGIAYDVRQIWPLLMKRSTWENVVSYRYLETGSIGRFLQILGLIPSTVSGSLQSYRDHFGINSGNLHHAEIDNILSIEVMKQMILLGRQKLEIDLAARGPGC